VLQCYGIVAFKVANPTTLTGRPTLYNRFTPQYSTLTSHAHRTAYKPWPVRFLSSLHDWHCSCPLNTNNSEIQAFKLAAPVRVQYTDVTQFAFKMCLVPCIAMETGRLSGTVRTIEAEVQSYSVRPAAITQILFVRQRHAICHYIRSDQTRTHQQRGPLSLPWQVVPFNLI
jgi:hypothetical protein